MNAPGAQRIGASIDILAVRGRSRRCTHYRLCDAYCELDVPSTTPTVLASRLADHAVWLEDLDAARASPRLSSP